ncbi:GNAT family N-acetyltransferase [Agromyces endophyticus]|uniref:GNAT family N-acetyltransferase n=1 Tax=Agromyces sp. H17E-10 TaxID=2932244 RepID=UPI001FD16852|nr:GNAT family N-acetyltransferase [Agromyces sp. H17E-10]UOQ88203.1 GNAT family N-acetyltransferase [Agromyces sp. H17E-10]
MFEPVELDGGVVVRLLADGDGPALAAAYTRNREHLAPWEPARTADFFTAAWHERDVAGALTRLEAGTLIPLVIEAGGGDDSGEIVGRLNLSDLVRGVFQNANLGYWVDGRLNGRGLATTAVGIALHHARAAGLHRVQAGTLVHNLASQRVLERNGFERIGLTRRYLRIAGEWQDHVLFARLLED